MAAGTARREPDVARAVGHVGHGNRCVDTGSTGALTPISLAWMPYLVDAHVVVRYTGRADVPPSGVIEEPLARARHGGRLGS